MLTEEAVTKVETWEDKAVLKYASQGTSASRETLARRSTAIPISEPPLIHPYQKVTISCF